MTTVAAPTTRPPALTCACSATRPPPEPRPVRRPPRDERPRRPRQISCFAMVVDRIGPKAL
ncbi:hypothetical protein [Streptosporangium sp. NBC_01469]|uniref:hypothetical protein n=1 Tax=Streptosporangium sp. NBC_01469 TaxID=2903898 RepID=UPI002E2C727A|nr:hypothetical protein [Streptosporangium sp. NBC_01469]